MDCRGGRRGEQLLSLGLILPAPTIDLLVWGLPLRLCEAARKLHFFMDPKLAAKYAKSVPRRKQSDSLRSVDDDGSSLSDND
ncbi:hypothetical protein NDU88_005469 [Pleurodeles waltl]|uniref:Uncharacterized protein n=1 Tax=Pleurodeles waltl TaxID=8319 RepID=A0AAV7TCS2_PLEWA|nr:hypothetical protein NDU88_005469 [Pleurodeles waltl]